MLSEANRQHDSAMPAWMVCWFFGLVLLGFAVSEYIYATDFENAGGYHPPVVKNQERAVRRSLYAHVAEWGYPHVGKWGCVAVFAVPSFVFFTAGTILRHFQRRHFSEYLPK